MPFKFTKTQIPDVILVETEKYADDRGYFLESFNHKDFWDGGIEENFLQDNFSSSKQNVLRGLHFQLPPFAQDKLVRVLEGKIWDVAVDIRKSSPTFKQWVGAELSEDNARALFIPAGFAHGFVVLSEQAKVLYKITAAYSRESEQGIMWNDPALNISWPVGEPILSEKDKGYQSFEKARLFD